ncbi:MAG: glycoside hydrolase family 5 protein, partial [Chloroflexota bacterium]
MRRTALALFLGVIGLAQWSPISSLSAQSAPPLSGKQFGVSIAGADFAESRLPGTRNTDYIYAADASRQQYLATRGQKLIRIPFRWERVQRTAFGPLWTDDIAGLRAMLDAAAAAGQVAILDMHNYARYYDVPLTRADAAKLNDVWQKLAHEFRGHPALFGYEIMNEPHTLPEGSSAWADLAQAATTAIRKEDSNAWVLVPGYAWQGAWYWPQNNASLNVTDPAGRMLYAAHQYFDRDGSGTYGSGFDQEGAYPAIGVD